MASPLSMSCIYKHVICTASWRLEKSNAACTAFGQVLLLSLLKQTGGKEDDKNI